MPKIILHCDLNCFYASVEMLYNPELRNVPMAVAGDIENRHGIILAKNVLAKAKGVKTGEAIFEAKNKCPNLVIRKADYENYIYYSKKVKQLYYEYTDKVESFGLDECWLDITGSIKYFGSTAKIVTELLRRVKEEIGLTLSIGVADNKIYAKLGSDIAKEDSYFVIAKKEEIFDLPASALLNVGRSTNNKLALHNINTIGDIANSSITNLKSILGKWGEVLYYFANGEDLSEVKRYDSDEEVIKSIGNSTTSIRDLKDIDDIKMILNVLSDSVASRCKDAGMYFKVVHLGLRNNKLETRTIQKKLKENSNLSKDIFVNALKLFEDNCDFTYPYRSIGVSVSGLSFKKDISQLDLFENNIYSLKQLKKEKAIDEIRNRFGYYKVSALSLLQDRELTHFDPKKEHTIFPQSYFK